MTFSIDTVEIADTFDVTINDPRTGEPFLVDVDGRKVAMSVSVYGPASKQYKAAQSAQSSRFLKRLKAKGAAADTTAEEELAATASFLSACTISLNHFTYQSGDPADQATFRALYSDPKMGWVTEQVNKELGDWSNFLR